MSPHATAAAPSPTISTPAHVGPYLQQGYAVVPQVFAPAEITAMSAAIDRLRTWAQGRGASFREGNLVAWVDGTPPSLRGMQWPAHREAVLDAARIDARMLAIVAPLVGNDLRQIINQIHWKPPGRSMGVQFHTDRENRNPPQDYRNLEGSYVQTAICIDDMTADNGPLLVVPGSHRRQHNLKDGSSNFTSHDASRDLIARSGYGAGDVHAIHAKAGDVLLWHVDTIHGSDVNRGGTNERRIYINGYCAARSTMRGHWAFIAGTPIPLPAQDIPVLVQHDGIWADTAKALAADTTKAGAMRD